MAKLLIATDIFGVTEEVLTFCNSLEHDYVCIGPYGDALNNFADESSAYTYFTAKTSVEDYRDKIESKVASGSYTHLIGFSVGASAIWLFVGETALSHAVSFTGFYGGQIRHKTELNPTISTHLIFPTFEPHFNVAQLTDKLKLKSNVEITETLFQHGFMNERSVNFDPKGYASMTKLLKDRLK